jgi:hypothetical protein
MIANVPQTLKASGKSQRVFCRSGLFPFTVSQPGTRANACFSSHQLQLLGQPSDALVENLLSGQPGILPQIATEKPPVMNFPILIEPIQNEFLDLNDSNTCPERK